MNQRINSVRNDCVFQNLMGHICTYIISCKMRGIGFCLITKIDVLSVISLEYQTVNTYVSYGFSSNTLWSCRKTSTASCWPPSLWTRSPPFLSTARSRLRLFRFWTARRKRVYSCASSLRVNVHRPSYGPQRSTDRNGKKSCLKTNHNPSTACN